VNTGAIVDVEPGEAEWTLDVLESLFDFYFVRSAMLAARKVALDKKLAEAGKPPIPSETRLLPLRPARVHGVREADERHVLALNGTAEGAQPFIFRFLAPRLRIPRTDRERGAA